MLVVIPLVSPLTIQPRLHTPLHRQLVMQQLKLLDYRVWLDIESLSGSTVDGMAAAVENACVVLMGVSREYKESTNCRLEAQYAMQREVPVVPLLLVEGYRADGWLGMLMGTRLWYGFFGTTLASEGAFEAKMDELCRELGDRGRVLVTSTSAAKIVADKSPPQLAVPLAGG